MEGFDQIKPTLYLDSKQLKEIKDWKVGDEYDLIVSVEMTGVHKREDGTISADFTIEQVIAGDKDIDDMDNTEFEDYSADQKKKMFSN